MNRSSGLADRGATLVELLLSIAIMGIAFSAILGGLGAAVVTSDVHRAKAQADTLLKAYAERIATDVSYTSCASPDDYTLGSFSAPGFVLAVTAVEVWVGGTSPAAFGPSSAGCADKGLQRITIQLTSPSARVGTQTTQIVKRTP